MADESAQSDGNSSGDEEGERFRTEPEKLSVEYSNEVTAHINRLAIAPNDACPVCGHWFNTVAPSPYKIEVQEVKGAFGSGRISPLLATVCHNCGFVRLFHRLFVDRLIEQHKNGEDVLLPDEPPEDGE